MTLSIDRAGVGRWLALGWMAASLTLGGAAQAGDPAALLRYVPPTANAILLMDADAVKKTKLALKNGWSEKHKAIAAERPLFLPPEADAIAIASLVDVTNEFAQAWELGIVSLQKPYSMPAIAKAEGGYVESIGGLETAWTPSEAYLVGLDPKTLGVMYPANRQAVSRWASAARRSDRAAASDYLQAAAKRLKPGTQVVLALDLKDVVPPHRIHQAVMETDVFKAKPEKRQEIARIVSGIEGITLTMEIDVVVRCTFHFDFAESSAPFANFAKPLLVELLNRMNLALPETDKFTVNLKGNTAEFGGQVPTTTLRRVFSLLEIPTTKFSALDDSASGGTSSAPQPSGADVVAAASQQYFQSVQALIDDLRSTLEGTRDNHAVWMERYGRKVDRLPILNVDEELLDWGAMVGETFRAMGLAQRDAGIRSGVRKSSTYGNYWYQYDNNGYFTGSRGTESMRNQITAEERSKAKTVRFERWKDLEDATAAIRKTMTQKHRREF